MAKKKEDHIEEVAEVMAEEVETEEVETEEVETEPKAEAEEVKAEPEAEEEKLVSVMIPLIPGEDPIETVIINGYITQIKKGEQVEVKPNVAEVLANKYQQQKLAQKNREKFKEQVRGL